VNPNSTHTASKDRASSERTRRKNMNHYQISSPRKVFAIAAVAMTAITIGLSVVVPAKMHGDARDPQTLTASKAMTPGPAEVIASPLRIYVVGVRDPELVSMHVRNAPPKRKQEI
jgi:hypothetical protein